MAGIRWTLCSPTNVRAASLHLSRVQEHLSNRWSIIWPCRLSPPVLRPAPWRDQGLWYTHNASSCVASNIRQGPCNDPMAMVRKQMVYPCFTRACFRKQVPPSPPPQNPPYIPLCPPCLGRRPVVCSPNVDGGSEGTLVHVGVDDFVAVLFQLPLFVLRGRHLTAGIEATQGSIRCYLELRYRASQLNANGYDRAEWSIPPNARLLPCVMQLQ